MSQSNMTKGSLCNLYQAISDASNETEDGTLTIFVVSLTFVINLIITSISSDISTQIK